MTKVEQAVATPNADRKSRESEHLPVAEQSDESEQCSDNLMSLEIALVRALQELVSKPEN